MIGTTLSHYRIVDELGRGGMGIVYKAEDTKLDRTVAIKILPSAALASADDRERFYREAKAAAALNHPNIAQIYQIDEAVPSGFAADDVRPFIAMEYIEGGTLEDRVKEGPLPLDEAIRIASEAADGLRMAHEKNIVHRDVKSANIMLTAEGRVKILDFGLAKTAQSTMLTRMGSTMGTIAYMSPEQARGEEVDRRADIWALGVILYEMMAGRNPFGGDYEQAVVYSILNEDPEPLTAIRTGVPMEFEMVVEKCLRKDAGHRYQSTADLKADLAALSLPSRASRTTRIATPSQGHQPQTASPSIKKGGSFSMLTGVAAGLLLGAALMWLIGLGIGQESPASGEVTRSSILLPEDRLLAFAAHDVVGLEMSTLDVSRDGRWMVYRTYADTDLNDVILAVRDLQTGESRMLSGSEGAYYPVFSPDGNWVAYFARDGLYRIPREGGGPRFVASPADPTGILWHTDGYLYWADLQGNTLVRSTPEGDIEELDHDIRCDCGLPSIGPDGTGIVVSGRDKEEAAWWHWDDGPKPTDIPGNHVRFLDERTAVFTRTGALYAARMDPSTGRMQGDEVLVLDDMRTGSILRSGHYAITRGGTLVYAAGDPSGEVDVIVRSADGSEEEVGLATGVYGPVDVSPSGRLLIIRSLDQGGQYVLFDRQSGGVQLTLREEEAVNIVWSSEEDGIVYAQQEEDRSVMYRRDLDTGRVTELFAVDGLAWPSSLSHDGRYMAYRVADGRISKLWIRNLEDGTEELVNRTEGYTYWAADWSRDGRFFTYTRVGDGGSQIFVEPFLRDGTFKLISPRGGEESEMLPDEDALLYRDGRNWLKVTYGSDLDSFSDPVLAFNGSYVNVAGMEYRVMPRGDVLLQRPINSSLGTERLEVISGFDHLVASRLGSNQ